MGDKSNGSSSGSRPRTRQRIYKPPPPLEVPDIEEDAAERKRILNVLAQRRYREKKRQKRMRDHGSSKEGTSQDAEDESSQSVDDVPIDVVDAVESTMQSPSAMFGMDMCFTNWDMLTDPTLPSMMPDSTASFTDFLSATAVDDDGSRCGAVSVAASSGTVPSSTMISNRVKLIIRSDRLGCKGQLWSLDALSPFNQGIATPSHQLPLAWRPTASQVLIPHHPLFDFLPWPNVRDKIIGILSLPDDARPPAASGPLALVNFAYDFEDNAEGVRIYGSDPCDPDCWEVGQVLFQRWWFLFDREIIDKSNHWRRLRGAPLLALTASDAENNAPNAT